MSSSSSTGSNSSRLINSSLKSSSTGASFLTSSSETFFVSDELDSSVTFGSSTDSIPPASTAPPAPVKGRLQKTQTLVSSSCGTVHIPTGPDQRPLRLVFAPAHRERTTA